MNLGSELRRKMRVGFLCGLLIGIAFYVGSILYELEMAGIISEIVTVLIGLAVFIGAGLIYDYEARKIPRIVAEMDKKLTKAKEQAKAGKFFCRYCGVENKKDAVYCEACGKKLS